MSTKSYGLFCPLAMACEVVEPRWTLLILSEMWSGATRFNEIRRGVPGISPTLLSKRLKEMEKRGLIERLEDRGNPGRLVATAGDGEGTGAGGGDARRGVKPDSRGHG